jgi:hypothetical protein
MRGVNLCRLWTSEQDGGEQFASRSGPPVLDIRRVVSHSRSGKSYTYRIILCESVKNGVFIHLFYSSVLVFIHLPIYPSINLSIHSSINSIQSDDKQETHAQGFNYETCGVPVLSQLTPPHPLLVMLLVINPESSSRVYSLTHPAPLSAATFIPNNKGNSTLLVLAGH